VTTARFSVGIDLGGTNLKFCVSGEDGAICMRHRVSTPTESGCDGVIEAIVSNISVVLAAANVTLAQVASIGIGVPGTVDPERGIILFAPNIFAVNVEIVRMIRLHFDVPVYLCQDSQAAAWAEYVVGAGQGRSSVAAVTLGTGIGCGLVIGGRIHRGGVNHTAGELGHVLVEFEGNECNCGRVGCLEAHAAGLAIVRAAKESLPDLDELLGRSAGTVTVKDVFTLAESGNAAALGIVRDVVKYIGMGLVSLANIVSPEVISISGGICEAPSQLLFDPLVAFVRERAYRTIADAICICRSPLGSDAPLVGVALLHRHAREYSAA
jgi:glucokinase